ncbi:hypothetical protein DYB37_012396 [Aphanomyces astaci]|uniref:Tc1-like transposase DDE domain-containing protein n=1 Tax=Aphanomyces astaci TaxID=112090 RepID=A0A418DTM0_APHAT|nr:hypothetical protein DYB35_013032 [Aphanomyces astaci]RHZ31787.1 hypothetical protein DYB37_012396 [Aphanomyces astaci]
MSADGKRSAQTTGKKKRVLAAYSDGKNWQIVAKHNGIALSTARRIVKTGQITNKPSGGAIQSRTKVTPDILAALERYQETNCQFTLTAMQEFIALDFPGTQLSKQTIRRPEPVQCAVSAEVGLVYHRLERGSIKMDKNAQFVEDDYRAAKASEAYTASFVGKKVVIVLDNAPVHSQTEQRVASHDDMVLLRLWPYSPMLNPIDSCFCVLKAKIKVYLAERTNLLFDRGDFNSYLESRMRFLEEAATECLPRITQYFVIREAMFCQRNIEEALNLENMQYGK